MTEAEPRPTMPEIREAVGNGDLDTLARCKVGTTVHISASMLREPSLDINGAIAQALLNPPTPEQRAARAAAYELREARRRREAQRIDRRILRAMRAFRAAWDDPDYDERGEW